MPLNSKISLVMFDRQTTGKGTPAATRKFGMGLRGGSPVQIPVPQKGEELTIASRITPSGYRDEAGPVGLDVTTRAWPRTIGFLLKLALGTGSDTVTGAGDPFTHTIIPSPTNAMDYATFWAQFDTEYQQFQDCRIDSLSLSWTGAGPLEVAVTALGTIWTGYVASTAPTNDDSAQQSFFGGGGTFQLDTITSTPVTADITSGTVTIANNLGPVRLAKSILPDDMWPGAQTITWTLGLIPTNGTLWRAAISGSTSGTAISQSPQFGSAHVLFTLGTSPARTLDLTSPKVSFDPGAYPAADPAGGPAAFEFSGPVVTPAAGAAFTAVVLNDQNSTAYGGS
jgi:hypothetical protein